MKHKFDLNEIETDEAHWELEKFRRDHYIFCVVLLIIVLIIIII